MSVDRSRRLVDKLGIREQSRIVILNPPEGYDVVLGELPEGVLITDELGESLEFIHFFSTRREELTSTIPVLLRGLSRRGMLWISWPKGSSRVETDLDENIVREIGLEYGLVDVKVCAVDKVWSALKFVHRRKDKE